MLCVQGRAIAVDPELTWLYPLSEIAVDLELTWLYPLSEFCSKQTKAVCVHQFPLPLWDSVAVCMTVIHVALVATSRISLTDQGRKKLRPVNQPYMADQGRR